MRISFFFFRRNALEPFSFDTRNCHVTLVRRKVGNKKGGLVGQKEKSRAGMAFDVFFILYYVLQEKQEGRTRRQRRNERHLKRRCSPRREPSRRLSLSNTRSSGEDFDVRSLSSSL